VDARNDGVTTGQQVEDAVELLTGGQVNDGLTGVGVQAILDAEASRVIIATTLAIPQAIIDPQQSRLNAMATWLETAGGMTPAELQTYADDLLSTVDGNPSGG